MSGTPKSLLNNVYSNLTVIKLTDKRYKRKALWECVCVCGNTVEVSTGALVSGNTKSCGCLRVSVNKKLQVNAVNVSPTDTFYADIKQSYPNLVFTLHTLASGMTVLLENTSMIAINFIELAVFHQEILVSSGKCSTYATSKKYIASALPELSALGYRVITLYQNEWESKKTKILNFLGSVLKQNRTTVFARKCSVKAISKQEANVFLHEEHIQGPANLSNLFYGLYDTNNILIQVVSFGKHHRQQSIWNKPTTIVLDRLAIKKDFNIPGGSSKIMAFAEKELVSKGFDTIVSWADKRISQGNLYNVLGFTLHAELGSDYSYWCSIESATENKCVVRGKQSNKKCNLKGILPTQTELEFTRDNLKQYRVYDCGKLVFVKALI